MKRNPTPLAVTFAEAVVALGIFAALVANSKAIAAYLERLLP